MSVKFSVNGKPAEFDGPEDVPLLWVVREHLGLTGSKFGCGIGVCGACTMHIDGVPRANLRHAGRHGARAARSRPSRACPEQPIIPCRRPGSSSTFRNAAIASPA